MIKGLGFAAQSRDGGVLFWTPSPLVREIKGTIACNTSDPATFPNVALIDTPAVALSPQGYAEFHGKIELPTGCMRAHGIT